MATRKGSARNTRRTSKAEEQPDTNAAAETQPASTSEARTVAKLDVFQAAATATPAGAASAARAETQRSARRELTENEEQMAEEKGAGRLTAEELSAVGDRAGALRESDSWISNRAGTSTSDDSAEDRASLFGDESRGPATPSVTGGKADFRLPTMDERRESATAGMPPHHTGGEPTRPSGKSQSMISDGPSENIADLDTGVGVATGLVGLSGAPAAPVAGSFGLGYGVGRWLDQRAGIGDAIEQWQTEAQEQEPGQGAFEGAKADHEQREVEDAVEAAIEEGLENATVEEEMPEGDADEDDEMPEGDADQPGVDTPAPDAVDIEKVLAWQNYLRQSGQYVGPKGPDYGTSNPGPEGTSAAPSGDVPNQQVRKLSMIGQPAGDPDDPAGTGGSGGTPTNWNSQRVGAVDPGEDQATAPSTTGPYDDPDVNVNPGEGNLGHLLESDDNQAESSSFGTRAAYRLPVSRFPAASSDDQDDEDAD